MTTDLGRPVDLAPRARPKRRPLSGASVDLEPLSPDHVDDLWRVVQRAGDSFAFLRYGPFPTLDALAEVISDLSTRPEQPFWAVLPRQEGRACGWLSLCDVAPEDAAIEVGSIWFAPSLQGTRPAREALFLLMKVAMDDLGYERLVWRCQAQNVRSYGAAERFGFTYEGTWRRAAIVKGYQRDVAWFSILAEEWPARRAALAEWCEDANFAPDGTAREDLSTIRARLA